MNILIDTCVIIDAIVGRDPFDKDAQVLLLLCAQDSLKGYITANSLTDIHYLISKKYDESAVRNIINNLLKSIEILSTTSFECKSALYSKIYDYEDAIQVESALHNSIDLIVTRNLKDYKNSSVPVCSPSDCLKKLGTETWG